MAPTVSAGFLAEMFLSFQGEGAWVGQRHLFLRLAGCNIRCRYCDTPDSLERTAGYRVVGPDETVSHFDNPVTPRAAARTMRALMAADGAVDAIALTGGEPLLQANFLTALLDEGRFGVPVLLETNGVLPQRLREVLPYIDIISMDIKLPSNTGEPPFWDAHRAFLEASSGKSRSAKILVDEGTTDDDLERATALLAAFRPPVVSYLQPITGPENRCAIDVARLTALFKLARRRLPGLRILPQVHKTMGLL
jgi:7-carboxy-7-deazaguanine synthase